jgi:hypothetical protein
MAADGVPNLDLMETPGVETLSIMNPSGEKSCCQSSFWEEMELVEPAGVRKVSAACSVVPSPDRTLELWLAQTEGGARAGFHTAEKRRPNRLPPLEF